MNFSDVDSSTTRRHMSSSARRESDIAHEEDRACSFTLKNINAQAWCDLRMIANIAYYYRSKGGDAKLSDIVRWAIETVHTSVINELEVVPFTTTHEALDYMQAAGFNMGQYKSGKERMRPTLARTMGIEELTINKRGIDSYTGRVHVGLMQRSMQTQTYTQPSPHSDDAAKFVEFGRKLEAAGELVGMSDVEQLAHIKQRYEDSMRPSDAHAPRTAAEQEAYDKAEMHAMKATMMRPDLLPKAGLDDV